MEEWTGEDWRPVSQASLIAWMVCYGLFLLHAFTNKDGFLIIDNVNLMIHEAGHLLFSGFGETIMLMGGTINELLAPLGLAIYFFRERQTAAVAFTSFWFFENFLYIGVYMADARVQNLPLVGSGDHDWYLLFGRWGVLASDTTIGHSTRTLGWLGMFATLAWLVWMSRRAQPAPAPLPPRMPLYRRLPTAVASVPEPPDPFAPKPNVLLLEENLNARKTHAAALRQKGFNVLTAVDGIDAARVSGEHTGRIDVFVTDAVMADISGPELAKKLAATHPEMKVLFLGEGPLQKPFNINALDRKLREIILG